MTAKKPADLSRARLAKRAQQQFALTSGVTPKSLLKTPSQKHSESGRKKLLRGYKGDTLPMQEDCTGCPDNPCGKKILACEAPTTRYVCKQCGCVVVCYRTEPRPDYCMPCRERKQ